MARDFSTVGVIGLGTMGAGIVEVFARNGFDVVVGGPPDADIAAFEEAGATWYLMGPTAGGEPLDETLGWVRSGPPASG